MNRSYGLGLAGLTDLDGPDAVSSTIRDRQTCFYGLLRSATTASRRLRSVELTSTIIPSRIPQTRTSDERGRYPDKDPSVRFHPLAFLRMLWDWQRGGRVQAIIATHSPIIMSLPGAALLSLDGDQIRPIRQEETEHYRVMRSFLGNPERALRELLSEDEE